MSRSTSPVLDDTYDRARPVGVFVVDADAPRRHATVGLLTARDDLQVLGAHAGSPAAVAMAVRALPHVCVVGSRVLAGPVPELVAEIEQALPATRCVRVPKALGLDPTTLTRAQRERQIAEGVAFVRAVFAAAGRPTDDLEAIVRDHFERARPPRPRRASAPDAVVATVVTGWTND